MSHRQTVLITGAAQRVGLHCAKRLVADGYQVILTCRRWREEWEHNPLPHTQVMIADFSSRLGIERFIEALRDLQPKLRAVIHNASSWPTDDDRPETFETLFMVHMQAPMMINNACEAWFDATQPADIIHLTDFSAQRGSAVHAAYCATKAGLENLTLSFAKRLAPQVKVNSIAPALIMFNEGDSADYRASTLAKSALGIEPGPEVVYQSIRYLMDNPYITGTSLTLNGGRHLK